MAIKTIPIKDVEVMELYHKSKIKFVGRTTSDVKITDEAILKAVFENYLEDD